MRRDARRHIQSATVALLALALVAPAGGQDAEPVVYEVPQKTLRRLGGSVKALASKGWLGEARELADVIGELGFPAADVERLRAACDKAAAKRKKSSRAPEAVPSIAKRLRASVGDLCATLGDAPADRRTELAQLALRIDGGAEPAHEILGHVRHDLAWVRADMPAAIERRTALTDVLRKARTLELPLEVAESPITLIERIDGHLGSMVRWQNVAIHSGIVSSEKLERILVTTLRAAAVLEWMRTGRLEMRRPATAVDIVLVEQTKGYDRAIVQCLKDGLITEKKAADARKMWGFWTRQGFKVKKTVTEAHVETNLLRDLVALQVDPVIGNLRGMQPCLRAGHLNWVSLAFIGDVLAETAWTDVEEGGRVGGGGTKDTPEVTRERTELLRLAKGGMAGSRALMRFLARRDEDPAYVSAIQDTLGKIRGLELLKATLVAEFLWERGEFVAVTKRSVHASRDAAGMVEALGMPLAELESAWRDWLLPLAPGIAERIARAPTDAMHPDERALLDYLDQLRVLALPDNEHDFYLPLKMDAELSHGARRHALYLSRNRAQAAKWPDAHEEYPDKAGFTPEGSLAGLHSVIAPGVSDGREAIDGWMGTFYHRLPLIAPGLLRVGWGLEKGIAVLDSGSMVAPAAFQSRVTWPARGMRDVPRRFRPELPNPVPGEDQSKWGYPVTLQVPYANVGLDVRMTLYEGNSSKGKSVDCHYSSPLHPTNPQLAPAASFCLIPKRHLAAGTTYLVSVTGLENGETFAWTFTTGR